MDDDALCMVYPTFQIHDEKGIIPRIYLPQNFRELVRKFYEKGRKERFESYVRELETKLKPMPGFRGLEIKLQWDDEKGLTNVSLGTNPGFDLNEDGWPHFQEHNLEGLSSFAAGAIATKYVSELLKSA